VIPFFPSRELENTFASADNDKHFIVFQLYPKEGYTCIHPRDRNSNASKIRKEEAKSGKENEGRK
jgi:hypothetical protein